MYTALEDVRWPVIIMGLNHLCIVYAGVCVGMARDKYKIPMPKTSGNKDFERVFRAHQNHMENVPSFLSGLWISSVLVHPYFGAGLGAMWCGLRFAYLRNYHVSEVGVTRFTIPGYLIVNAMHLGALVVAVRTFF